MEDGQLDGGVGLVTEKNFDKVVTADIKAAVTTAIEAVQKGTVKVSTALGDSAADVATIRESVRP